jgi:divalent metal cation (Fe/Co/Zn/Cd) transporter
MLAHTRQRERRSGHLGRLAPWSFRLAFFDTAGTMDPEGKLYRRRVLLIVGVIAALAAGQTLYALSIGNRFLLKDGIDWIYDVVLWAVALAIFGRGRRFEDLAALGVAGVMFVAGLHTGYDLWDKIATGRRAEVWVAGWSALTAIGLALFVLGLMLRFRASDNPLVSATWLSSRNDAISTTAFALVGFGARVSPSQWPEILLDVFVIGLSFQAVGAIALKVRRDWRQNKIHKCQDVDRQAGPGVASSDRH